MCEMSISHLVHYRYVPVAVTTFLRVTDKITRSAEKGHDDNWSMSVMNNM